MREAVEVQAVVPVRAPDQRQAVRAEVPEHVSEADRQVVEERRLAARPVVERNLLVEDREVARLLEVGDRAEDEPERVVVEAAADVVVAALRERLVLVVAAAVRELRRRDVEDAFAGAFGNLVDEADEVLVRVAEAHAAPDAALEERRRAGHVERHHALVLVPDVDHTVDLRVSRPHRIARQEAVPVGVERGEGPVDLRGGVEALQDRLRRLLVDDARTRPFLPFRQFDVAEREDERLRLARLQGDGQRMRGDRAPAVRDRVAALPREHGLRPVEAAVEAEERLAVGVEAVHRRVDAVEGVMVAPLAVFGLVVERPPAVRDLDLARGEVALEVLHVRRGVPEAPLGEREDRKTLRSPRRVREGEFLDFGGRLERHEREELGPQAVLLAGDARVAEAVAAFVEVERRLAGLPARVPDGLPVADVEVAPARVRRHAVVAVAREAAELGVAEERVAAGRVGDEREEVLRAEVVDPRPGRLRAGDDVFAVRVVEMSESHWSFLVSVDADYTKSRRPRLSVRAWREGRGVFIHGGHGFGRGETDSSRSSCVIRPFFGVLDKGDVARIRASRSARRQQVG